MTFWQFAKRRNSPRLTALLLGPIGVSLLMSNLSRPIPVRVLFTLLVCSFVAAGGFPGPQPTKAAESTGIQTVATAKSETRVWLRADPDSDSKVISKIASGTVVKLLGGPKKGAWYFVKPANKSSAAAGWVSSSRLNFDQFVEVESDGILRAKPFDESPRLGELTVGTVVTIAGPKVGAFVTVMYGDEIGYAETQALEPAEGPASMPPPLPPTGEWWVDVNRSTSTVNLMIGVTSIASIPASVSRDQTNGFYGTAVGTYWVYEKIEGLQYTSYAKAYFMYWAGFDPNRFNGFHSWTMNSSGYLLDGGWGPTSGCVSTSPADALAIYNFVSIGTRVEVHW